MNIVLAATVLRLGSRASYDPVLVATGIPFPNNLRPTSLKVRPRITCTGYIVSGAGAPELNGCYVQSEHTYDGREIFAKDDEHKLYCWRGIWKLGSPGHNFSYFAITPTPWPPESITPKCGTGWEVATGGVVPCPAVKRSNLPPPPPVPPPPPTPAPAPMPPTPPMRLVWEDHFDGPSLNSTLWNVLEQVHRGGVYTKENVRLENGSLVLQTIAQNLTIPQGVNNVSFYVSSGAVNTSGLFEQRLGRWEARVKLPMVYESPGYTLHSSIWLFANTKRAGHTGCPQEIDIVEQYTSDEGPISDAVANLHPFNGTKTGPGGGCMKVPYKRVSSTARGDWTSNWTVFAVDWTESYIAMSVNGEAYANFNTPQETAVAAFTDPLFLALTACVMDRVPVMSKDVLPLQYEVDWVKVYAWT